MTLDEYILKIYPLLNADLPDISSIIAEYLDFPVAPYNISFEALDKGFTYTSHDERGLVAGNWADADKRNFMIESLNRRITIGVGLISVMIPSAEYFTALMPLLGQLQDRQGISFYSTNHLIYRGACILSDPAEKFSLLTKLQLKLYYDVEYNYNILYNGMKMLEIGYATALANQFLKNIHESKVKEILQLLDGEARVDYVSNSKEFKNFFANTKLEIIGLLPENSYSIFLKLFFPNKKSISQKIATLIKNIHAEEKGQHPVSQDLARLVKTIKANEPYYNALITHMASYKPSKQITKATYSSLEETLGNKNSAIVMQYLFFKPRASNSILEKTSDIGVTLTTRTGPSSC